MRTIKVSCWNIQGYNSSLGGKKLLDPDFTNQISKSDIVGLSETHIFKEVLNELDIPNFTRLGFKIRKKMKNANKTSGGLAIFVKNEMAQLTELYETENTDVIWIKLKQKSTDYPNDIYIGSVYFCEENAGKILLKKLKNWMKI